MTNQGVNIQAHDNAWTEAYTAEANAIRTCLGRPELRIEHIGSTAVPGLAAKPVLDIMIGVEKLSETDNWEAWLKGLGYEQVHHPGMPERRFFRKGSRGAGTHHLHVYEYASEAWINQCLFRDELRTFPDKRLHYERLKHALVRLYPNDRKRYTAAKAPFIQHTIERAKTRNQQPVVKEKPKKSVSKVFGYITRMQEGEKQVLVFQHSILEAGIQIPKGTVQHGEDLKEALFREMTEETGINHFSSCQLLANDECEAGEGMIHRRFFYELPVDISLEEWSHQPNEGGTEGG